jgi:hypothetical protein
MISRSRAAVAALALLALSATPVLAGSPDPGHADQFHHDPGDARLVLDWHFASATYPAWFQTAIDAELDTHWQDVTGNNSNVPRFSNGNDNVGGGAIVYTSAAASPCTGSTIWLACNPASGVRAFFIYVRSIPSTSAPTWLWFQRDATCTDVRDGNPLADDGFDTSVCFSIQRATAHEGTHLPLTRLHNDAGADAETFMQSSTPTPNGSPANWNRKTFLPCDAAAAQLEYGLADPSGRYADCFDVAPGDGAKGLNPTMSLATATSFTRCVGQSATANGRLALADVAAYEDMRNTPLVGRTVRIDRRPVGSSTWTNGIATATATGAAGSNWSRAITSSTGGSFQYRASFSTTAAETAVNSSGAVTWTIQWATVGCPS